MTRFYIDPVNGSDSNGATNWGDARRTTLNLSGVSAGDEISIAKTDSAEVSLSGTYTGSNGGYFLTGSTSLGCKTVVRAVSSWTNYNSATVSTATGRGTFTPIAGHAYTAFNGGSLTFPASPAANTKYGVMDLGSTQDLSGYVDLSVWICLVSTGAWTDNHIVIKLCSDAAGDTAVETFTVTLTHQPSTVVGANIHLLKGSALSSTVRSIAFYSGSSAPVASSNFYWSYLVAYPTSAELKAGDWVYNADKSVYGKVTFLDDGDTSSPDLYFGYAAHRNWHDWSGISLKRRRPYEIPRSLKSTTAASHAFPLRYGGSSTSVRVVYKGGYNTGSDMVDGITFLDDSTPNSTTNNQKYFYFHATYPAVDFITMENLWVGGVYGPGVISGASSTATCDLIMNNCANFGMYTSITQMGSGTTNRPITKWRATDCFFGAGSYYMGGGTTTTTVVDVILDTCTFNNGTLTAGTSGVAGDVVLDTCNLWATNITTAYNNGYGLGGVPALWWLEYGLRWDVTNSLMKGANCRWTQSSRDATNNGRWNITGTGFVMDRATATLSGRGVWEATTTVQTSWNWSAAVFTGWTITGYQSYVTDYSVFVTNVTWGGYPSGDFMTWQHCDIRNCYYEGLPGGSYISITLNHCYIYDCTFKSVSPTGNAGHIRFASGTSDISIMRNCQFYAVRLTGAAAGGAGGIEATNCTWNSVTGGAVYTGTASYGLRIINPNFVGYGGGSISMESHPSSAPWLGPPPGLRHGLCYEENKPHTTYGPSSVIYYGTQLEAARYSTNASTDYQRLPGEASLIVGLYEIPIANVAVVAGREVTASVWCAFTNSAYIGYMGTKAGQLATDQLEYVVGTVGVATATWEQISIVFTPSASGIMQFYVYAQGLAYFAGFTCTQE